MGYSGLENVNCSDSAADALHSAMTAMVKSLKESIRESEDDNIWNTSGVVNVALINESIIQPNADFFWEHQDLVKLLHRVRTGIIKELAEIRKAEPWDDKQMHIAAYKRMIRNLEKTLDAIDSSDEWIAERKQMKIDAKNAAKRKARAKAKKENATRKHRERFEGSHIGG